MRHARDRAARRLRDRLDPDAVRGRRRLRARLGLTGARGGGAPLAGGEAGRGGSLPRRARDEGRLRRGAARLEHLVDCVLQFEGDRYRLSDPASGQEPLRSTNELGVFEMTDEGLEGVPNPSSFSAARPARWLRRRLRARGHEAAPARGPGAGRADRPGHAAPRGHGVDPKRLAMIVTVLSRHAGLSLGQADVFVNVASGADRRPGADLAVAMAIPRRRGARPSVRGQLPSARSA